MLAAARDCLKQHAAAPVLAAKAHCGTSHAVAPDLCPGNPAVAASSAQQLRDIAGESVAADPIDNGVQSGLENEYAAQELAAAHSDEPAVFSTVGSADVTVSAQQAGSAEPDPAHIIAREKTHGVGAAELGAIGNDAAVRGTSSPNASSESKSAASELSASPVLEAVDEAQHPAQDATSIAVTAGVGSRTVHHSESIPSTAADNALLLVIDDGCVTGKNVAEHSEGAGTNAGASSAGGTGVMALILLASIHVLGKQATT